MALTKGMFVWYKDSLLGLPVVVAFQYNPAETTRTLSFRSELPAGDDASRSLPKRPLEQYALARVRRDRRPGARRSTTAALGIAPRLAALEMLMQPVGTGGARGAAGEEGARTCRGTSS